MAGRDMLSSNQKIEKDQFSIKNQIASINDVQELERNHKIQKDKFHAGAQEMFDNSQAKYGAKLIVLKKHHNRRQEELKQSIKMLQEKFMQLQKQQRLKHLQQHEKLMQIKKNRIKAKYSLDTLGDVSIAGSEMTKGSYLSFLTTQSIPGPKPIKSKAPFGYDSKESEEVGGAVLRQKRRKTILIDNGSSVHLKVEIHNEGVVVAYRNYSSDNSQSTSSEKKQTQKKQGDKSESKSNFIPWGLRARVSTSYIEKIFPQPILLINSSSFIVYILSFIFSSFRNFCTR